MLILQTFKSPFLNPDTKEIEVTDGFVYSSKSLLYNLKALLDATPERPSEKDGLGIKLIGLDTDFTFNLITEGWTDGGLGGRSLHLNKTADVVQEYRPILCCVNRYENFEAYKAMFEVLPQVGEILDIELPRFAVCALCADGHLGCKKAIDEILPSVNADGSSTKKLGCYAHIKLNSVKNNSSKLVDKSQERKDVLNKHLAEIHLARSDLQFQALSPLLAAHWEKILKEPQMADYYSHYLSPANFHITATTHSPHTPSNQAKESSHRVEKVDFYGIGRCPLGVYISQLLPKKLSSQGNRLANKSFHLTPPLRDMPNRFLVSKAVENLFQKDDGSSNYFTFDSPVGVVGSDKVRHVFERVTVFNSSAFYLHKNPESAMTKKCAEGFIKTLVGKLPKGATYDSAKFLCLSKHMVWWSNKDNKYVCTCKNYWSTGECSHILAKQNLLGDVDLDELHSAIHRPRLAGRPRKYKPVAIGCHDNSEQLPHVSSFRPSNLIGLRIAVRLQNNRMYFGTVGEVRYTGTVSVMACIIVWLAVIVAHI